MGSIYPAISRGVALIAEERVRQVTGEGYTSEHDDGHRDGQLAAAGAYYAIPWQYRYLYRQLGPFVELPKETSRIRDLVKAGALIAAEIERLIRDVEAEAGAFERGG